MKKHGIDRRVFIATGTAAVAGLAAPSLFAQSEAAAPLISVGYWPRVQKMRAAANPKHVGVYAAESITVSEPSFLRTGARIRISGIRRAGETPLLVTVDIKQKADLVDEKVAYYAWSYKASPKGIVASSPVAFNVPVEMDSTLDLIVRVRTARGEATRVVPFTVGSAEGALKLNSGSYILAMGDRVPDWTWLRFEDDSLVSA